MISLACFLFLLCLSAGLTWEPWVLGIAIAATVCEWGLEQQWPLKIEIWLAYRHVKRIDSELRWLHTEIAEARYDHEMEEVQALQAYYVQRVKDRERVREDITELRDMLDGSVEGVDYPVI